MAASLNEILSSTPAPAAATPAPAEPVSAPAEQAPIEASADGAADSETGEDVAETPTAQPEAAQVKADPRSVPIAALKDERRKRQDLERKLAELEGQIKVYSQVAKPANEDAPKVDPADEYYRDPVAFTDRKIGQVYERLAQEKIAMSEVMVRQQHDDYDDAVGAFVEATKSAPHLVGQMRSNPHPALFAYQAGKAYLQAKDFGSVDEMRTKLREQLRAEIVEEVKREHAQQAAQAVQPSLANARGAGTSPKPQWRGPTPLKQIFGR